METTKISIDGIPNFKIPITNKEIQIPEHISSSLSHYFELLYQFLRENYPDFSLSFDEFKAKVNKIFNEILADCLNK